MASSFSYKKNCFYIEDHENVLADDSLFSKNGESSPNDLLMFMGTHTDIKKLDTAISLNHEMNHYIHELSNNTCIVHGDLLDHLAACVRELSQYEGIRFPLLGGDNYIYNRSLCNSSSDLRNLLETFEQLYKVYDFIFLKKHSKPDTSYYRYNSIHEQLFVDNEISVDYILETYAYHKAYWDAFAYCNTENEKSLRQVIKNNDVYPIVYRDNGYTINNFKRSIEFKKPYHQLISFLLLVGLDNQGNKAYLDYCENVIPKDYRNSPALMMHSAYRLILETSLNIPSLGRIMTEVVMNHKSIETFSPVHRFYLILKAIREYGGYPDAVPGEDFFKTFHNWISSKYGWLSFDETFYSVSGTLYSRAEANQEVITNFQLTALSHKFEHWGRFVQKAPIDIIASFGLPIILHNQNYFIFNQILGNTIIPSAGLLNIYSSYFGSIDKYESYSGFKNFAEQMPILTKNNRGALREIVNRLFSSSVFKGLSRDGVFVCPFCKHGCPRATPSCKSFSNFTEILANCQKLIFRTGTKKFYCADNYGNSPDCMFYNYLLDNNYKF